MDITTLIIGACIGGIIGAMIMKILLIREVQQIRNQAVRGSRNSITGEIYEKVLPALPGFPFAPKDMVFIGKGCDYIIFDGLSRGDLREIIFLELKSGKSVLNANEKMIRDTLRDRRVRYTEYRIGTGE